MCESRLSAHLIMAPKGKKASTPAAFSSTAAKAKLLGPHAPSTCTGDLGAEFLHARAIRTAGSDRFAWLLSEERGRRVRGAVGL